MRKMLVLVLAALLLTGGSAVSADKPTGKQKVIDHLMNISVTVVTNRGEGSGVLVTRNQGKETVTFVWTAAHVVESLRQTRSVVDSKTGATKTAVEFDYGKIVRNDLYNGETIGKDEKVVEVVRYSAEEDLALLRIRKKNYVPENVTVRFYEGKIPALGTHLIHVGSLLGQMGSNSYTEGPLSQHGRMIKKQVFDQTAVTAFPGSSGGGVYLEDGRLIGLVLRGAGETFNLIVPVRRMRTWAKRAGVEWAINPAVPVPTDEQLRTLPVEDNGTTFSYAAKKGKGEVLLLGNGPPLLGSQEEKFPTLLSVPSER